MEQADIAKQKLLHDCEVLHHRLQDSTVDFFIEQENKLILETASTADDAIDLLATSDNHINLLLAEVLAFVSIEMHLHIELLHPEWHKFLSIQTGKASGS